MIGFFTVIQATLIMMFGAMFGTGLTLMMAGLFGIIPARRTSTVSSPAPAAPVPAPVTQILPLSADREIDGHPDASVRAAARMTDDQKAAMATLIMENKERREAELAMKQPTAVISTVVTQPTRQLTRQRFERDTPSAVATPVNLAPVSPGAHRAPSASPLAGIRVSMMGTTEGYRPLSLDPVTATDLLSLKAIENFERTA